jgi:hypothetical protein
LGGTSRREMRKQGGGLNPGFRIVDLEERLTGYRDTEIRSARNVPMLPLRLNMS